MIIKVDDQKVIKSNDQRSKEIGARRTFRRGQMKSLRTINILGYPQNSSLDSYLVSGASNTVVKN
jgi:hypothetical protein